MRFGDRAKERNLRIITLGFQVNNVLERPSGAAYKAPIEFSERDCETITVPHADPLLIKLIVVNIMVSRVVVDEGISSDIIFWDAFQRIGIDENLIQSTHHLFLPSTTPR